MASDFAPVQPVYLNLGQILGQAEDIKSSRMQQQLFQQRMQGMQQEHARMEQLRGLYSGGRNPQPQELAAVSPEYAQQAQRLQIDNMNAENGRIGEIQKVTKEAAINALKMWENTGRAPDAWPAILGETGRQLQSLGIRHPNGHLVGEEIDPNKVTPQMIMQIAGWEDPGIKARREAEAEAMKAGARVNAEQGARMPYDIAKEERDFAADMEKRKTLSADARRQAEATERASTGAGQKKFDEKMGEDYAKKYSGLISASSIASENADKMQQIGKLLDDVDGGKLAGAGFELANLGQSLGIQINKDLPNVQAAQAMSRELALQLRNPEGGAGMPGALSDSDRQFLESMTPNVSQTREGRAKIIDAHKMLAKRAQVVAQKAQEYKARRGMVDDEFYTRLREWSNRNPVFK